MKMLSSWLERHITLHSHDDMKQEFYNSITHAIGAVLSVIALIFMILKSLKNGGSNLGGITIFGLSMILLYTASSLYHRVEPSNLKRVLRIMDHSNIYFLIAGTYTPIAMFMKNKTGNIMTLSVWLIAILGIIFTLVFWGKLKPLHVLIYLIMGWLVVFFWQDFRKAVPSGLMIWMIAGGLTYSVGVIFYAIKKIPFYHPIWHIFVVGGSACFFTGIYKYLI